MQEQRLDEEKTVAAMQKAAVQSVVIGTVGMYLIDKPKPYYMEWLLNRQFVPRQSSRTLLGGANRDAARDKAYAYMSCMVGGNMNFNGDSLSQFISGAIHKDAEVVMSPAFSYGLSPTVRGFVELLRYCAHEEDIDLDACRYFFDEDSNAFQSLACISSAISADTDEAWHQAIKHASKEQHTEDRNLIYAALTALKHLCSYDANRSYDDLPEAQKAAPIMSSTDDGVVVSSRKPVPYFTLFKDLPISSIITLNDIAVKASMLLSAEAAGFVKVGKSSNSLRLVDMDEKADGGVCSQALFVSALDSIGISGVKEYKPWYDWFRNHFSEN